MDRRQAEEGFREEILPIVLAHYGLTDIPARREAWNDYIDSLARDKSITEAQAASWDHPSWIEMSRLGVVRYVRANVEAMRQAIRGCPAPQFTEWDLDELVGGA